MIPEAAARGQRARTKINSGQAKELGRTEGVLRGASGDPVADARARAAYCLYSPTNVMSVKPASIARSSTGTMSP